MVAKLVHPLHLSLVPLAQELLHVRTLALLQHQATQVPVKLQLLVRPQLLQVAYLELAVPLQLVVLPVARKFANSRELFRSSACRTIL